jgi:hypothetical protein
MPALSRRLLWPCLAALAVLPAVAGCSTLLTVAYLVRPNDMPAEFAGLKGKKVAVVCRPVVELEFSDAGSGRELASLVDGYLVQNVRRVKVVGQQEVARWIDENSWVDYQTVGTSLDADHIIGIDLEEFRLHEGSTLFRGRACVTVKVFDIRKGEKVFEKRIDDYAYPASSGIPTSDSSEIQFRAVFLNMLARQIARSFHAYESREYFAEQNLTF